MGEGLRRQRGLAVQRPGPSAVGGQRDSAFASSIGRSPAPSRTRREGGSWCDRHCDVYADPDPFHRLDGSGFYTFQTFCPANATSRPSCKASRKSIGPVCSSTPRPH